MDAKLVNLEVRIQNVIQVMWNMEVPSEIKIFTLRLLLDSDDSPSLHEFRRRNR